MRLWIFFVYLTASIAFGGQLLIADPVSSVTSPPPAASTASDKEAKVFDPKAYGAAGDGVTDDTAAFVSVVSAATAAKGTVQIPAGTYIATIAVTTGGITIQGAGKDATIIKAPNATAATRVVVVTNSDSTTIRDLTIDGNKSERFDKKPIRVCIVIVSEHRL